MAFAPSKADTILPVNAQTPLSTALALERFKVIAGRVAQIINSGCRVNLLQFAAGNAFKRTKSADRLPIEEAFRALVSE